MAYCGPRGIPHSQFLRWSDADRAAAMAWQQDQAERCPSCRVHPKDTARGQAGFHAEAVQCLTCRQLDEARAAVPSAVKQFTHVQLLPGPPPRPDA